MAKVEFKNVTKIYKMGSQDIYANNDVNFVINDKEFCVIVGPSGAGKTTILNLLGGMEGCDSGDIIVDNIKVSTLNEKALTNYRRHSVGFVFQFYNLMPNLTALKNIEIAAEICKEARFVGWDIAIGIISLHNYLVVSNKESVLLEQ